MRLRLVVLLAIGMALVFATVAQAHTTKWSWTESYAEARVVKTVRYKDASGQAVTDAQAVYDEAKQRYDIVKRQSDACSCNYAELSRAISDLSIAQQNLSEAKQGYPVVDATCIGSGPAVNGIRFKHFRCVVIVRFPPSVYGNDEESFRRGRVYVHVRDKTRMYYRWI